MDIKKMLLSHGKKTITLDEIISGLKLGEAGTEKVYTCINDILDKNILEPVKSSGINGNIRYPMYKKYRIAIKDEIDNAVIDAINKLHPMLLKSGYLSVNPSEYQRLKTVVDALNIFFFEAKMGEYISRKERSFEIFGHEKTLDDSSVKSFLRKLKISEKDLRFYDTPEYCFHDYIPIKKDSMTLLICENKDIWFGIRRRMFESGWRCLFGTAIDGVIYGEGNKVSDRTGALVEYLKFMGNPQVRFLYWGDIDREGFDIYRRTKAVNDSLDISLFVPGYRQMMAMLKGKAAEDSPSSKKHGMDFDSVLQCFSADEQVFLKGILEDNKLIPQEIISYTGLKEG